MAENKESRREILEKLPRWKVLLFALSVCERMEPLYAEFMERVDSPRSDVLRHALDRAWDALKAGMEASNFTKEANACLAAAKEVKHRSHGAWNAASSISVLMTAYSRDHMILAQAADAIAGCTYDTIMESLPKDEDQAKLCNHSLMKREIKRQIDDMIFVYDSKDRNDTISAAEKSWRGVPYRMFEFMN